MDALALSFMREELSAPMCMCDVALEAGDVIHTINGTSVKTSEELRAALNRMSPDSPLVLQIERSGKLMFVAFKSADTK